jgi:transcriptional regulator with XRE-family HTH domain
MTGVSDSTESLLSRTKKLLDQRGELSLREIAEGAGVGHEWVRGLTYGAIKDPGISRLEKLHNFLTDYHAAQRFQQRSAQSAN